MSLCTLGGGLTPGPYEGAFPPERHKEPPTGLMVAGDAPHSVLTASRAPTRQVLAPLRTDSTGSESSAERSGLVFLPHEEQTPHFPLNWTLSLPGHSRLMGRTEGLFWVQKKDWRHMREQERGRRNWLESGQETEGIII